jgi:hypothetical protein
VTLANRTNAFTCLLECVVEWSLTLLPYVLCAPRSVICEPSLLFLLALMLLALYLELDLKMEIKL